MTRPYILDVLDQKDAHRFTPAPRKTCAACGESGEFDCFYSHVPAKKSEQMHREYGGDCCVTCILEEPACDECGTIGDVYEPIRASEFFDDRKHCLDCERAFEAQARRYR